MPKYLPRPLPAYIAYAKVKSAELRHPIGSEPYLCYLLLRSTSPLRLHLLDTKAIRQKKKTLDQTLGAPLVDAPPRPAEIPRWPEWQNTTKHPRRDKSKNIGYQIGSQSKRSSSTCGNIIGSLGTTWAIPTENRPSTRATRFYVVSPNQLTTEKPAQCSTKQFSSELFHSDQLTPDLIHGATRSLITTGSRPNHRGFGRYSGMLDGKSIVNAYQVTAKEGPKTSPSAFSVSLNSPSAITARWFSDTTDQSVTTPMIALYLSGTTHRSAGHNVALSQESHSIDVMPQILARYVQAVNKISTRTFNSQVLPQQISPGHSNFSLLKCATSLVTPNSARTSLELNSIKESHILVHSGILKHTTYGQNSNLVLPIEAASNS
ncbi:protein GAMETE EXPRESSED 3 [Dorcoceras hygrometricum]|uniref:Protein GAMETE EXPRESSED 3 n=1 Tax=Dorcoceras hygrometricum TaxID=472368 RepID=A0A2Z7CVC4_9LAMI|nr:protein GAMETE EXPRESSED 3 [Dorcoceras hygrometricum]